MHFKKFLEESKEYRQSQSKGSKRTKYGLIKEVNFTIVLLKNG